MDDDDELIELAKERLKCFTKTSSANEWCKRNGRDYDEVRQTMLDELKELQIKKRLKDG